MQPVERIALRGLFERLAEGDRSAMDPAYRALWSPVLTLCTKLVGADAEDVAQKALLRLFAQSSDYDPERDPFRWALSVAGWECRSELKRRSRARVRAGSVISIDESAATNAAPDVAAEYNDTLRSLKTAMKGLSPADLETIERSLRGESLGPRLRKRKERALRKLRRLLGRSETTETTP